MDLIDFMLLTPVIVVDGVLTGHMDACCHPRQDSSSVSCLASHDYDVSVNAKSQKSFQRLGASSSLG